MKCKCGADLSNRESVKRTYINKDASDDDTSLDQASLGHYSEEGDYEPDTPVDLSNGRYDLVDGSDTCVECEGVVG